MSDSHESGSLSGGLLATGVGGIGAGVGVWRSLSGGEDCGLEYGMLPTVVAVSLASSNMAWTLRSCEISWTAMRERKTG